MHVVLDQYADILTGDFVRGPTEQPLGGLIVTFDDTVCVKGDDAFGGVVEDGLQAFLAGMYLRAHLLEGIEELNGFPGSTAPHAYRLVPARLGLERRRHVGDRTAHGVLKEQIAGRRQGDGDERDQPQGVGQPVGNTGGGSHVGYRSALDFAAQHTHLHPQLRKER